MELAYQRAMAPAAPPTLGLPGPQANPADIIARSGGLPPGVTPVDTANIALRENPTGALPAAGRGNVTGGVPQRGSPTAKKLAATVLRMFGRVK
jgi:hypothetical protein